MKAMLLKGALEAEIKVGLKLNAPRRAVETQDPTNVRLSALTSSVR